MKSSAKSVIRFGRKKETRSPIEINQQPQNHRTIRVRHQCKARRIKRKASANACHPRGRFCVRYFAGRLRMETAVFDGGKINWSSLLVQSVRWQDNCAYMYASLCKSLRRIFANEAVKILYMLLKLPVNQAHGFHKRGENSGFDETSN